MKDRSEGYSCSGEEHTPSHSVAVGFFLFFLYKTNEPLAGDQDCYLLLVSVKKLFTTSFPALQPMPRFP